MDIDTLIKSAFEYYQAGNLNHAGHICQEIINIYPNTINAIHLLVIISYQQKDYDSAIKYVKKLIDLTPENARAYYILGHSMQEKRLLDEAIAYYHKALQVNPQFADVYYNLGSIFQDKKRYDEAIFYYQQALQLNPTDIDACYNLGRTLQENKQYNEAVMYYQKALQLNPALADAYNNIGIILQEKEQLNEALSCFQKAIQSNPNCFEAYSNMGNVFIIQGKLHEGTSYFKKALQLKPDYAEALLNIVRNQSLSCDDSEELFQLTKELIKQDISEHDMVHVYFAMGKLCDNLKMFEKSFEYYRLGNMLKRAQVEFNIDAHVDYLSRIRETFSVDFIKHRKSWGSDSEMPIFIFGMPRSGTTLVEQILASHPNVYGGGELQFFNQMDQKLASLFKVNEPYPECLNFIDDLTAYDIAELYLRKTRKIVGLSKDYKRFTDKNPFNFYYLGLISLLFPKARFIHCQRHPLDTCISIYFQEFTAGNHFAYDLRELGLYYREYLKLMNYWQQVLFIHIFELRYEDIVQHQEDVTRKLVEFCGLEWDSECLNFYKKDRPVFTASNWQVRQPIYTTSCGRWQNYEQFLDPLKESLADFI
jgi:tetratricopeptide (TPR) repeat protein